MKRVLVLMMWSLNIFSMESDLTVYFNALKQNDAHVVGAFLKKGMPINVTNKQGESALWHACCFGSFACVELLLSYPDVDVNIFPSPSSVPSKRVPLYYVCSNTQLAEKQKEKLVRQFLEKKADLSAQDYLGDSLLFKSIERGSKNILKLLADAGAYRGPNKQGITPLRLAVARADLAQVKELLNTDCYETIQDDMLDVIEKLLLSPDVTDKERKKNQDLKALLKTIKLD